MAQNVLLKYGDTSVISGETIQQGKLLIDTQKGEISIDKDGTTRLPLTPTVDTALSTTSTNAIANNAITNSIINTTAEVSAITADNVPCGTKPVKELINNLNVETTRLTNKFATLTGTSISGETKVADYPTGFTISNSVIISLMVQNATNVWYCVTTTNTFASYKSDGIYLYTTDLFSASRPFRIVLMRTDI